MGDVVAIAMVVFLLVLGGTRLWVSRCIRLLSVEQKALVLDSSSLSASWFPFGLALFAAFMFWVPEWPPLPRYYWMGAFATYLIIPFLLSAAMAIVSLIRLSRLNLPVSFIRRIRLATIIYHVGFLFLTCAVLYSFFTYASRRDQHRQTSNRSMESTASRCYDLLFASLNTYPVAMRGLARGDSSCSR